MRALLFVFATACATGPPPLRTIEHGIGNGPVVVLLHGYGSRPEHFEGFADRTDLPEGTRVVLPYAPLTAEPGFAWFLLTGDFHDLRATRLAGMAEARARVIATLDDVERRLGVTSDRIVLGGFSQGAMMSLDVALHDDRPLAGIALMSGTLFDEAETRARAPRRRGLRVYMSHGTSDDVLPYAHAMELADVLRESGLEVEQRTFEGGHVVTEEVSTDLARLVSGAR